MVDSHNCESMLQAEAWIEKNANSSTLNINRIATKQDLEENHYLEEIGQTIYQIALDIKYCPYCGCKLNKSESNIVPDFTLYDFSKW